MDIQRFLKRIGFQGKVKPDLETLSNLQERFLLSVPFENLDIHYSPVSISLDEEWFFEKIVDQKRGGICYENNGLFAWALRELGYHVELASAQMMPSEIGNELDDHHMFIRVVIDGWPFGVDVGNGQSFRRALCEEGRIEEETPEGDLFRFGPFTHGKHEGGPWRALCAERLGTKEWGPLFVYEREPRDLFYFKEACRFQQTDPHTRFTQKPFASLATTDGRITITPRAFKTNRRGKLTEKLLGDEASFLACLKENFGIVPEGPRLNPFTAQPLYG